ncbi:LuxR C-terminal-related transcriptional regulator [Zestomonas carbonaria]|uniref:HTH-type transcriptional regulator MalT n=1 Tax=Zestomonas carbonaria TaxID=2762745 RepID=A0A7U7I7Z2_9GAMM|nr:LuxR C-terminal-related transcriptional regulator [Pseudomonas carbonaria]CAD5106764.1 HTH-type transcriptional regulator MalT [Pseudomonas carbonaria]
MPNEVPSIHVASALPRLPAAHVPRPRLSQRLLGHECRLTLVCAPAGYGKSVLLGECVRRVPAGTRLVWLDLLGHPLEPAELLARLAAALQAKPGGGDPEMELAQLLGHLEQPLWIVLDDYPRQPCAELDACLGRLLERAPHTLRWWIGGRRRPDWSLPRLLLQGDLLELGARDLALDQQELDALLGKHQVQLPAEQRALLLEHSDGWLAAICLLLLQGDPQNLAERLAAGPPLLQEYVSREVLADLPGPLRHGLTLQAYMPRFCAALCAQVLEDEGGARLFDELRQRQLFLHDLDGYGEWFRLERPLATILKQLHGPHEPLHAHERACQWFSQQGRVREAVEHALRAERPDVAASHLQRYGEDMLLLSRNGAQFLAWRDELPAGLFTSTPRLITLQAWALIICARLDEVDTCLDDLARFLPQPDARRQQQLLAQYQSIQGVLQRQLGQRAARQHSLEALEILAPTAWTQRVLCYQMLTQQALAESDLNAARHYNHEGLRLARQRGNLPFESLLSLERVHLLAMQGEGERALDQVEQSLQDMQEDGRHGPVLVRLLLLRGKLLAARGASVEAGHALRAALEEGERCQDAYLLYAYLGLAELAAENGEFDRAQQLLRKAERQMHWLKVQEVRYREALQHVQGLLWLYQGEADKARECFRQVSHNLRVFDLLAPSGFYDLPLRNRLGLAQADLALGQIDKAATALQALERECREAGLRSLACECLLVLAEARLLAGRSKTANGLLDQALDEAQRLNLLPPLRGLLARQRAWLESRLPAPAERQGCLSLLEPSPERSPLTRREAAVLKLIAQGLSNQQIAELLCVSLHTVKSHARHINAKLGVERRTQAVAHAKAQGWLS